MGALSGAGGKGGLGGLSSMGTVGGGLMGIPIDLLRKKLNLDQGPAGMGQYQGAGQMSPMPGSSFRSNLFDPEELQRMYGITATPPFSLMTTPKPPISQMKIPGLSGEGSRLGQKLGQQSGGMGSAIGSQALALLGQAGLGRSPIGQGALQGATTGMQFGGPWGALGGGVGGALLGRRGASAAQMAGTGAQIGSMIAPGIGTGIGAGAGALLSLLGGGKQGKKPDMQVPITPFNPDEEENPFGG